MANHTTYEWNPDVDPVEVLEQAMKTTFVLKDAKEDNQKVSLLYAALSNTVKRRVIRQAGTQQIVDMKHEGFVEDKLLHCKQDPGESMQSYEDKFCALSENPVVEYSKDVILKSIWICGIQDERTRHNILDIARNSEKLPLLLQLTNQLDLLLNNSLIKCDNLYYTFVNGNPLTT
ncbi:hypothetical protein TrispH2_012035 [Trichoplax sp. H2]|nr:hypothetical protein TrispH2_012035 [Trichoplax sp. H2]|eukprot:RDD35873.1 hypothetical protein TrispH2_012035 [Trichoplax sp. H2]